MATAESRRGPGGDRDRWGSFPLDGERLTNKPDVAGQQPSDRAILAGYSLALSRAANDFESLDEDLALDSFRRGVVLVKAAGELIVALDAGGPS